MIPDILALDLSLTRIGVARRMMDSVVTQPLVVKGKGAARLAGYRSMLSHLPIPALVVKEALAFGSQTAAASATIHTVADLLYYDWGVPVVAINGQWVKGYMMGKCVGDKTIIGVEVLSRFGRRFDTDDETDAFILMAMALDHYGAPLVQMPAKNRAWLEKVDWPSEVMLAR